MTKASSIVEKIKLRIEDESLVPVTPELQELASDYAELCSSANKRLLDCRRYIEQRMISEAINIAEKRPKLLDLCAELDFMGVEAWGEMCGKKGLEQFEPIDAVAMDALNNAYADSIELEPLLKDYRRAVRKKDTKRCISLLRLISRKDSESEDWKKDLAKFEKIRIGELREEYQNAKNAEDVDQMAEILVELDKEWIVPIDNDFISDIRKNVRRIYEEQDYRKGAKIVERISAAYSAFDLDKTENAINEYRKLLQNGYFKPDEDIRTQFDEADEWVREERKKTEDEKEYQEILGELKMDVENGSPERLSELLNRIARLEREIPDMLKERALSILTNYETSQRQLKNRRILASGVVVMLILLGIGGYAQYTKIQKLKAGYIEKLNSAYDAEALVRYEGILADLKSNHGLVYKSSEIRPFVLKSETLRQKIKQKVTEFESTMQKLKAIQDNDFDANPQIVDQMIGVARKNAIDGKQKAQLAVYIRDWHNRQADAQRAVDARLQPIIDKIANGVVNIDWDYSNNWSAAESQLEKLQGLVKDAENIKKASPDMIDQVERFSESLGSLKQELEKKRDQLDLIKGIDSLKHYLYRLQIFATAFPNDPLTALIRPIIELEKYDVQLTKFRSIAQPNNYFWGDLKESETDGSGTLESAWESVKSNIITLEDDELMTAIYYDSKQSKFAKGRPKPGFNDVGVRIYKANIYKPGRNDKTPEFNFMEVTSVDASGMELMPHCKYVKALISAARFARPANAKTDLLQQMNSLYDYDGISPLLKLRLTQFLAGQFLRLAESTSSGNFDRWQAMLAEIESIPADLHWLCVNHPDVKMANQKSQEILNKYFGRGSIAGAELARAEAVKLLRQWSIECVGHAGIIDPAAIKKFQKTNKTFKSLLVLRKKADSEEPELIVAFESLKGGKIAKYIKLRPGEPIFAIASGHEPRYILEKLEMLAGKSWVENYDWPNVWPRINQ